MAWCRHSIWWRYHDKGRERQWSHRMKRCYMSVSSDKGPMIIALKKLAVFIEIAFHEYIIWYNAIDTIAKKELLQATGCCHLNVIHCYLCGLVMVKSYWKQRFFNLGDNRSLSTIQMSYATDAHCDVCCPTVAKNKKKHMLVEVKI